MKQPARKSRCKAFLNGKNNDSQDCLDDNKINFRFSHKPKKRLDIKEMF